MGAKQDKELAKITALCKRLVLEAGGKAKKSFEKGAFTVSSKKDNTYLTTTDTEIEMFEAYETLRAQASSSDTGDINENNAAGDASFYFNHSTKTSTIFLTLQQNGNVYAFEYLNSYHSRMKSVIELL